SFMAFCVLRFWFSNLFFKVEYEWTRVFNSLTIGGLLILVFYFVDRYRGPEPRPATLVYSLTLKLLLAVSFPALLYLPGVHNKTGMQRLGQFVSKLRATTVRGSATPAQAPAPAGSGLGSPLAGPGSDPRSQSNSTAADQDLPKSATQDSHL